MTKKGVYPYGYIDSTKIMKYTTLPKIKHVYNRLNKTNISDEE